MNASIDAIRDAIVSAWIVPVQYLQYVCANTVSGCALRRFLVHVIARLGAASTVSHSSFDNLGTEAFKKLLAAVWGVDSCKDTLDKKNLAAMNTCQFHRHEAGVICNKKKAKT
jgi:hypothetical protein